MIKFKFFETLKFVMLLLKIEIEYLDRGFFIQGISEHFLK